MLQNVKVLHADHENNNDKADNKAMTMACNFLQTLQI